ALRLGALRAARFGRRRLEQGARPLPRDAEDLGDLLVRAALVAELAGLGPAYGAAGLVQPIGDRHELGDDQRPRLSRHGLLQRPPTRHLVAQMRRTLDQD